MKSKKNYIKALIAFPTLALAVSIPTSNSIASISGIDNEINKTNSDVNAVSSGARKEGEAKAGAAVGDEQQQAKPTLDLNSDSINKQYSANKFYVQNDMPSISNANGPILLGDNGRSIAAYDWYGNPAWFLNLNSDNISTASTAVSNGDTQQTPAKPKYDAQASYYKYSNALSTQIEWAKAGKKIVDVAYLASRDFLYVLTDTNYLFLIQSTTGTINSVKQLEHNINKISFIDFNNSLYGWDSTKNNGGVYEIDTQRLTTKQAITNEATGTKDKYIFDILPVSTGYNIALISNTPFSDEKNKSLPLTLTALLIQDNGNIFNGSDGQPITEKEKSANGKDQITINLDNAINKYSDVYSTTLKKSDDSSILIVGNKVYNITLNKSAMENTTIKEIEYPIASDTKAQAKLGPINSAFIDESKLIYFKDNTNTIYQISLDNKITNSITIQTSGASAIFNDSNSKSARIYPVNKNGNEQIAIKGTGYVASPENFIATGFKNGGLLNYGFTTTAKRPTFSIPTNYQKTAPSSFDYSSIKPANSTGADQYKTEFYSDDISGELYIKTRLNVSSWYDNSLNASTSSYVIGKWNCAKIETVTTWANQNAFNRIAGGLFAKRSPDQISDDDVTKYADQILSLPPVVTSSDEKEVKMIVTDRSGKGGTGGNFGKITLQATVKYKNKKGNIVSYFMNNHEYNVKKEAESYNFKFYGGDENDSGETKKVDISTLGSSFTNFKNTLPSLVNPSSDNLQAFIETEDKYPTDTRRVITVTDKNDDQGTMTIKVHYNGLKVETPSTFSITYTGMATKTQNRVEFDGETIKTDDIPIYDGKPVFENSEKIKNITTITQYKDYDKLLATDIDVSKLNLVYKSNLSLMGFNPEISIEQDKETGTISSHDAEYGSINIVLDYTNSKSELLGINLPKEYWNDFGLSGGKITQRYIGFLPIGATYGVELKSYNSPEVQEVVQNNNVNADIAPSQLISTLDVRGYNTEGQTPNITIQNFSWNGENLTFAVHAQSTKYNTVTTDKTFTISWSPKFAAIRQRNLIISSTTSILGVALVSAAVTFYIMRRNKIRRFMK